MKSVTKLFSVVIMILASSTLEVGAQSYVTYNHDDAKMNQITVQEIGSGGLTPAFYYDVFHRSYQRSAGSKNKLTYRSLAGVAGWQQVEDADSVKSSLEKRAEIEALNVADRQIDLAWVAEGTKITNKLNDFQNNINRIVGAGGTFNRITIISFSALSKLRRMPICRMRSERRNIWPSMQTSVRRTRHLSSSSFS